MTTPIQEHLQRSLAEVHATTSLDDIVRRGNQIRRRRRLPAYSAGLGSVIVIAIVSLSLLPAGQTSAFASWTALPTALHGQQAAAAEHRCRQDIQGASVNPLVADLPTSGPAQLVEGRGHFSFVVFTDGRFDTDCLSSIEPQHQTGVSEGGRVWSVRHRTQVISGDRPIAVELAAPLTFGGGTVHGHAVPTGHVAAVWGWVASDVASVRIDSGGMTIDASIRHGIFGAWWPNSAHAVPAMIIRAYSATNRLIDTVRLGPCDACS